MFGVFWYLVAVPLAYIEHARQSQHQRHLITLFPSQNQDLIVKQGLWQERDPLSVWYIHAQSPLLSYHGIIIMIASNIKITLISLKERNTYHGNDSNL